MSLAVTAEPNGVARQPGVGLYDLGHDANVDEFNSHPQFFLSLHKLGESYEGRWSFNQ